MAAKQRKKQDTAQDCGQHAAAAKNHAAQPANVRELALHCLLQTKSALPFPVILEQAFAGLNNAFSQNKAFLMTLCYGVLRHHGMLRQLVRPYCRQKPGQAMEYCLSLCLYELFFLHKEDHVSVNEYVAVLKKQEGQAKANALNAIVRTLLKDRPKAEQNLEAFRQILHAPVSANRIPARKTLRKLHELAGLGEIFTDELDKNFIQILAEESFCTPLPSYRLNRRLLSAWNPKTALRNALFVTPLLLADGENGTDYAKLEQQGVLTRQGICSALLTEKISAFLHGADYAPEHGSTKKSAFPDSGQTEPTQNKENLNSQHSGQAQTNAVPQNDRQDQAAFSCPQSDGGFWDMCCGRGGKTLGLMEKDIPVRLVTEPSGRRLEEFREQLIRLHFVQKPENENNKEQQKRKQNRFADNVCQCGPYRHCETADNKDTETKAALLLQNNAENTAVPACPLPEIRQGTAQEGIAAADIADFPCILLDSPCTTSGTIARNPEVRYRIDRENLENILAVQAELLELAHSRLQNRGFLFYCTCSVFYRENKGQIKNFLSKFPDMRLISEEYLHAAAINPRLRGHDILYFAVLQKQH